MKLLAGLEIWGRLYVYKRKTDIINEANIKENHSNP